jgi:methylmalonyl-CoA/ethylmalonyl-CoA epimerase
MRRFHHIGLFVHNLNEGLEQLKKMLEIASISEVVSDENLLVHVQFVTDISGLKYELIAPFGVGNPVDPVLKSKKNILNHIAYVSNVFERDIAELREAGAIPLGVPKRAKAFNGCKVVFFLTKLGFIFELIEGEENTI